MSITGRLDFTDLDKPQAMPPIARAERAHSRNLGFVHTELHKVVREQMREQEAFRTPPRRPRRTNTTESIADATSPGIAAKSSPSTHSTQLSDAEMIVVLTARLEESRARMDDAMEVIRRQQGMLDRKNRAEQRLAALQAVARKQHYASHELDEEVEEPKQSERDDESSSGWGQQASAMSQMTSLDDLHRPVIAQQSTITKSSNTGITRLDDTPKSKTTGSAPGRTKEEHKTQEVEEINPPVEQKPTHSPKTAEKSPKLKAIHCRRFNGKEE